jgi:lysine 2,3-aminomutase
MINSSLWQKEMASSIKTFAQWKIFVEKNLSENINPLWEKWLKEESNFSHSENFSTFILPSLAAEIFRLGPNSALAKQFIDSRLENETNIQQSGKIDPISDQAFQVAPGFVHRYCNRALMLPLSHCPVHCRFCFRRNEFDSAKSLFQKDNSQITSYLLTHPEIEEIILTGGDPLLLSNQKIEEIFEQLSSLPTIRTVRFHSRVIPFLPSRILDGELPSLLQKWSNRFQIILGIHTNHLSEWYHPDVLGALGVLQEIKIMLLSQTVLLKGINDDAKMLRDLMLHLCSNGVRPYYLHHPDLVKGAMHFWMEIFEGQKIYQELKESVSGWALPHYVVDMAHLGGKKLAVSQQSQQMLFIQSGHN